MKFLKRVLHWLSAAVILILAAPFLLLAVVALALFVLFVGVALVGLLFLLLLLLLMSEKETNAAVRARFKETETP